MPLILRNTQKILIANLITQLQRKADADDTEAISQFFFDAKVFYIVVIAQWRWELMWILCRENCL